MAWTQADLDKLDAAISAGAALKSMTFGDQSFEFRDMTDMLKARALIAQALNAAAGTPRNFRVAATSKGL